MKKIISFLLVGILLMTSLLVLTGCNKGGNENGDIDKSVKKYYENAETGVLQDKWNGLELKFAYPKDKGYEIEFSSKKIEFQNATLESEDLNSRIELNFNKVSADEVTKRKENYDEKTDEYTEYEEIEFAGYKGLAVNYSDWSGTKKYGMLMLTEVKEGEGSKEGWYALDFSIEKISTSSSAAEFEPAEYYKSEDFQNLLNSLQFKRIDPVEVDGVLGDDRYIVVKELTAPNDEYTVSQYPDTNGVMSAYMLKNGKYSTSGAYFRVFCASNIDENKFGTLDKVLDYYQSGSWNYTYTDETLAGQNVKVEHNPKSTTKADKYSVWESGYFEKDGKVFNFLYYRYEDVPEEIGTQLIQDVLNGISFCEVE